MIDELRNSAKKILKEVKYIIGYEKGSNSFSARPFFITNEKDIESLIFSPLCSQNLAKYIKKEKDGKIGIVAKGCDTRAIIQLIQEKIISRDDIYVIGIVCNGVIDKIKLEQEWWKRNSDLKSAFGFDIIEDKELYKISYNGMEIKIEREKLIAEECMSCRYPVPLLYDVLIEQPKLLSISEPKRKIENMEVEERKKYWLEEFDKCIRCYACRSICPLCYCKECSADPIELAIKPDTTPIAKATNPIWLSKSVNSKNNLFFQLVRIFHTTGRCVSCVSCSFACPVGIELNLLTRKMVEEVKNKLNHEAGMRIDDKPILAFGELDE
ncbi:MAG: Coenzyme F420 hydrogenase/dehydrogenase, beta subunit C-terminal domain [Candidatus Thermoplasmatota archaeon]